MRWLGFCVLLTVFLPGGEVTAQERSVPIFPPAEYDHYYEGDLTIRIVATIEELYAICQLKQPNLLACTLRNHHSCVIVLVDDDVMRRRSWTTGMLLRHEMGHCNGWPGDHPNERRISWPTTHWAHERLRIYVPSSIERPDDDV